MKKAINTFKDLFDWLGTRPYGNRFFHDEKWNTPWIIGTVHSADRKEDCVKFMCHDRLIFAINFDIEDKNAMSAVVSVYSDMDEDICITMTCEMEDKIPDLSSRRRYKPNRYYLISGINCLNNKIHEDEENGFTGGVALNI